MREKKKKKKEKKGENREDKRLRCSRQTNSLLRQ